MQKVQPIHMKPLPASTRNIRFKAGCVPIREKLLDDGTIQWEVLLVQSCNSTTWLFPKGSVEQGEVFMDAGLRETLEEAGVSGVIGPKLGTWILRNHKNPKSVKVQSMWLLFVHNEHSTDSTEWLEHEYRVRQWCSFDKARTLLMPQEAFLKKHRAELLDMLKSAEQKLYNFAPFQLTSPASTSINTTATTSAAAATTTTTTV